MNRKDRRALTALVGAIALSTAVTAVTAAQILTPAQPITIPVAEETEQENGFAILKRLQSMILIDEVVSPGGFAMRHLAESVQNVQETAPAVIAEEPGEAETVAEELPAIEEPEPEAPEWYSEAVPLSYYLQGVLFEACETYGVPYGLALGVIETESNFDPYVVSSTGDYGLMQVNDHYFHSRWFTPEENIWKGVEILRSKYEKYWDWSAALTAYNAGYDTGSRRYANRCYTNGSKWGFWMG